MRSIAMFCRLALIASLAFNQGASAQEQPPGEVSGRVISDETGKPLKGVEVRARGPGNDKDFYVAGAKVAYTDKDGYYTITGLKPGSYTLFVNKDGFVPLIDDVQARSYEEGLEIPISQGESRRNVDFRMVRGGIVTGKITAADGDAVIGQGIIAFLQRDDGIYRSYTAVSEIRATDDRGIYRIYGLPAGKYLIGTYSGQGSRYGAVYYPGVRNKRLAKPIEISAGQEISNVDFNLGRPDKGYSISGRAIMSDGTPITNVSVIARSETSLAWFRSNPTDAQGNFTIQGVDADIYSLQISPNYLQANMAAESKRVVVDSSDIAGIVLEIQRGATISGSIEIEGGGRLERVDLISITVVTMTDDGSLRQAQVRTQIRSDYTFTISGVPSGMVRLHVLVRDHRYFLKSILSDNGDITNFPIEIPVGANLSGIRIILTPGAAVVSGTVSTRDDKTAARGSIVHAVAEDLEQRRLGDMVRSTSVDPWGRYMISGLAPGRYLIFVQRRGELGKLEDLIINHQADAIVVNVKAGENKILNLTLNR